MIWTMDYIYLSSKAFVSQEIENLVVLKREPSSGDGTKDQAVRLASFGHPPRRDSNSVFSRFRQCSPRLAIGSTYVEAECPNHALCKIHQTLSCFRRWDHYTKPNQQLLVYFYLCANAINQRCN